MTIQVCLCTCSYYSTISLNSISPEQCLRRGYYNISTCWQRAWTSMSRKRQLTPSSTGSRVHATCCCPLSPLPSHTAPALRRRSSSGCCLGAHRRPVHKSMRDEGFPAGTNGSFGWSSAKECRSRVQAWSLVLFLLSPFSWAVFVERLLQLFYLLTMNLSKHWIV